ncbi:MAG: methionine adenosyltransferase [Flavobacteriaceae bacterium]|nr:methionine adenosyltransferase [Flavobacteriaceae bacterium]
MSYLFTSESVSEGHPDKVADQISDAILDHFLAFDPNSKVACETLVTTGQVILAGEVHSEAYVDLQKVTRSVIEEIGYTDSAMKFSHESCGILSAIHEQAAEIRKGVEKTNKEDQGAGDQGMMFGYAVNETTNYMPMALDLSHMILLELAEVRKVGLDMTYLRPDAKAQVTLEYNENHQPIRIHTIVVSTQHDEFGTEEAMQERIRHDIKHFIMPRVFQKCSTKVKDLFHDEIKFCVNPTGSFVIGGPHGDSGLTGRKIIVDTYGGKGAHGGGAFSGKDPSKVDRSAAYAMRHLAKNMVAAGIANEILVQISYAIGVKEPVSMMINTYGTANVPLTDMQIKEKIIAHFDFTPYAIEQRLKLRNPIYKETAAYGHMGREPKMVTKTFYGNGSEKITKEVELFTWEKLDMTDELKTLFKLN